MKVRIIALLWGLLLCAVLTACQGQEAADSRRESYDLGVQYLREGNYEEAVPAFTEAIDKDPDHVESYLGRGDAYAAMVQQDSQNYDWALADFERARELQPDSVRAYRRLAELYLSGNERTQAAEILRRGVEATGSTMLQKRLEFLELDGGGMGIRHPQTVEQAAGDIAARCAALMSQGGVTGQSMFFQYDFNRDGSADYLVQQSDSGAWFLTETGSFPIGAHRFVGAGSYDSWQFLQDPDTDRLYLQWTMAFSPTSESTWLFDGETRGLAAEKKEQYSESGSESGASYTCTVAGKVVSQEEYDQFLAGLERLESGCSGEIPAESFMSYTVSLKNSELEQLQRMLMDSGLFTDSNASDLNGDQVPDWILTASAQGDAGPAVVQLKTGGDSVPPIRWSDGGVALLSGSEGIQVCLLDQAGAEGAQAFVQQAADDAVTLPDGEHLVYLDQSGFLEIGGTLLAQVVAQEKITFPDEYVRSLQVGDVISLSQYPDEFGGARDRTEIPVADTTITAPIAEKPNLLQMECDDLSGPDRVYLQTEDGEVWTLHHIGSGYHCTYMTGYATVTLTPDTRIEDEQMGSIWEPVILEDVRDHYEWMDFVQYVLARITVEQGRATSVRILYMA